MISSLGRREALLASIGLLAGCTSLRRTPFYGTLIGTVAGDGRPRFNRATADRIPYATMAAWFSGAARALLVLGKIGEDNRLDWYTAQSQILTTLGPIVVSALGFEVDLRETRFGAGWSPDLRKMSGRTVSRLVSFQADRRVDVLTESRFSAGSRDVVEIYDVRKQLSKVTERVSAGGRVRHSNHYWIDPGDGFCWKAEQRIDPNVAPLNFEILRRPKLT